MTDWIERGEVTAKDLLEMQEAVEHNEAAQAEAWSNWQHAVGQLGILEQTYENAKWNAQCAREELKQMTEAIKGDDA